ncbi:MAG: tetratricopeptide repeat protein [Candidatus Desulfaltia sp.]|nr:tetratricopeptide repeat protein [Candidatus Desulfaltia sp.]
MDITDKAKRSTVGNKNYVFISLLFVACCFGVFSGCSLPRIIVLKDPLTPQEHLTLGIAYEKRGELDPAIKEYKLAAKKLPLAYLYLGNVYFQKKELDEAEKYCKKAIKKDPQNADAHNNLAWLYYTKKENLNEAERLVLKALELNPSKENIYGDTLEKIRGLKNATR